MLRTGQLFSNFKDSLMAANAAPTASLSRENQALPWPAIASVLCAYVALANVLKIELYWLFCAVFFLIGHFLSKQPLRSFWPKLGGAIFIFLPAIGAFTVFGSPVKSAFLQSMFLSNRAIYFLAYLLGIFPCYVVLQPLTLAAHRSLAALAVALMILAGHRVGESPESMRLRVLIVIFGVFYVLWLERLARFNYPELKRQGPPAKRRLIWSTVVVALLVGLTVGGAFGIRSTYNRYFGQFFRYFRGGGGGMATKTNIGHVSRIIKNKRIALWYERPGAGGPVYLVGIRYRRYHLGGSWTRSPTQHQRIESLTKNKSSKNPWHKTIHQRLVKQMPATFRAFDLKRSAEEIGPQSDAQGPLRLDRIISTRQRSGILYTPFRTQAIATDWDPIHFTETGTAFLSRIHKPQEYWVLARGDESGRGSPSRLRASVRKILTQIPESMKGKFKDLALKLSASAKSDLETATKIEDWFIHNFKYRLEFDRDHSIDDPIEDFLMNRKSGWCEFFASSMVLLLRSLDIPARYVGGYIAHDFDKGNNTYTVRGADAHAWVEVYLEDRGWRRFDPTPPAGRQQNQAHQKPGALGRLMDALQKFTTEFLLQSSRFSLKEFSQWLFFQILGFFTWLFQDWLRAAITLSLLAYWGYKRWTQRIRSKTVDATQYQFSEAMFSDDDRFFQISQALFDKKLEALGWHRPRHWTPRELCEQLKGSPPNELLGHTEPITKFAEQYGALRYLGRALLDDDKRALQQILDEIGG